MEDLSQTTILLLLGGLFLVGFAADLVGRFTPFPRVTLLLICGVALGPSGFSVLPELFIDKWFPALTSIALGLIGFLLGHELSISAFRMRGRKVITLSLAKALGAAFVVGAALLLFGVDPIVALLLAGIATATAPAATYDVVHESGVSGEFAETLLSVVALDDVWGLVVFLLLMAAAGTLNGDATASASLQDAVFEVGGSLALGAVLGVPMAYLTGRIKPGEPTLVEALGFVLIGAAVADWLGFLPIMTAMVMGSAVASLAKHHERPFHAIQGIELPFMILFFVLAGASLRIDALLLAGSITAIYIVLRSVGTYLGTLAGAYAVGVDPQVGKRLGLALLPQAGVAIGMSLLASQRFPEKAPIILPVVLASTVVFEIAAPVVTRRALRAAAKEGF